MKTKLLSFCLFLCLLAGLYLGVVYRRRAAGPRIYDETADGSQQIAAALRDAQKEDKRVLLIFGANWCIWCHRMNDLFSSDPAIAAKLKSGFVVREIDVSQQHNRAVDAKYGNPTRFGLPVILLLDGTGRALTTKNTAELEEGRGYDRARVLAFLAKWAPPRQ
jgi:thiol:disulfide interchange protein